MPSRDDKRGIRRGSWRHVALMASASVAALAAALAPLQARNLWPSGAAGSIAATASAAAHAASAQAAAAAQQARQPLARAMREIQDKLADQARARGASTSAAGKIKNASGLAADPPDGLVRGGLSPDSGIPASGATPGFYAVPGSWQNIGSLSQSAGNGQTTVTIQQTAPKAILSWSTFNVGRNTTVYFDQSAGNSPTGNGWIALNRVLDPSGSPSQILGHLKADGSIYLINQNGIIFGGSSQINVGTLLASTLGITDSQFNFGILYQASSDPNIVTPAFVGTPGQTKPLTVQAGAIINAAPGGKVLLLGGNVTNNGTISTPQGQTILAAGDAVYLEQNTAPESGGVRGIVANVDNGIGVTIDQKTWTLQRNAPGSGWTAQNTGIITADEGNITLVGQNVTQNGILTATTSAALDGSIKLWARSDQIFVAGSSSGGTANNRSYRGVFGGTLTFGPGSVTEVRPDLGASDSLLDPTSFKPSSIDIVGKTIVLKANAAIVGEAANVAFRAADVTIPVVPNDTLHHVILGDNGSTSRPDDGSRIYLDAGSRIDVSGLRNVPAPMERNSVVAELRGDEFADFPQLRNGPLRGQTIYVDRRVAGVRRDGTPWVGTPYGDVSGWLGLVPYKAGELMSAGGSIRLESRGDIITRAGSLLSASGGSIAYADGYVRTSKIVWRGHIYDISQATPDMTDAVLWDGSFVVNHQHWGVRESFASTLMTKGRFERGYVQGQSGGQLLITAHHAVLDGAIDLSAGAGDATRGNAALAVGGKLTLGEALYTPSGGNVSLAGEIFDRTLPQVVIGTPQSVLSSDFSADRALSGDLATTVYIRPDLINNSGVKDFIVNTNQTFTLSRDASITLALGGSLKVLAGAAVIDGKIRAPAGDVIVQARLGGKQDGFGNTVDTATIKSIRLDPGAIIDASGLWINLTENRSKPPAYSPAWVNGGNVSLSSERQDKAGDGVLTMSAGSLIDVSSGGLVLSSGKLATTSEGTPLGNAGTISLIGNALEHLGATAPLAPSVIAGQLRGYGLGTGGSLALAAATIQIGGAPSLTNSELYLDPSSFESNGFSNYRIIGWNGVTLAPGVTVEPKARSFIVHGADGWPASGARLIDFAAIDFKPDQLRAATNLALYAPTYGGAAANTYHVGDRGVAGDIVLGAGSVIRTDPGATVDIRAARELAVYGTIQAPGGTIRLANDQESGIAADAPGTDNKGVLTHRTNVTLWIDATAQLLASGLVQINRDPVTGLRSARVFDGGSVSLTGDNIVVQPGSVVDVSGAVGAYDRRLVGSRVVQEQRVATNAGRITTTPGGYLYFDPILRVQPGDGSAQGASFAILPVTSVSTTLPQAFNLPSPDYPFGPPLQPDTAGTRIRLRQGSGGPSDITHIGDVIPQLVTSPTSPNPRLELSVFGDALNGAGFDDLIFATRDGVVAFQSSVAMSARRSIQFLTRYIGGDGSVNVTVNAPYVAFGGGISKVTPNGDPAAAGTGTFTVNASLIDFSKTTTFGVDPTSRVVDSLNPLRKTAAQAGFKTINFNSTGDIRFLDTSPIPASSPATAVTATLNAFADVTFAAAQLYPTTRSGAAFVINDYAVDATGKLKNPDATVTILGNGRSASIPLSANGSLTIAAGHIIQGGVVRAPAGQITLTNATVTLLSNLAAPPGATITLAPGSVTSADLDGALVPYGQTRNGVDWVYGTSVNPAAPQKLVTLSGPTIDVQAGALVSSSGGGDLLTYEFVPGPGGSKDVLAGNNVFAIIPSYRGPLPADVDWGQTSLSVGNSVYLTGIPGLAAGTYTLLPGHYALLPGAFRVTIDKLNSDHGPEANVRTAFGGYLTAGYLTDQFSAAHSSSRGSTFLVTPGGVVRTQTQYNENRLSAFLAGVAARNNQVAPRLPNEPGRIQINATSVLTFEGNLRTAPVLGGRGGQIDIASGGDILITGSSSNPIAGTLVLRADQLSQLQTESLLIGGTRSQTSQDGTNTVLNGASVTVNAGNITVDTQGTVLSGTEIILVAKTAVTAKSGSIIQATGTYASAPAPDLVLDQGTIANPTPAQRANDGAAVLAVSNGAKPNFRRGNSITGALPAIGNVVINDGVRLDGGKSLLIDGANVTLAFGPKSGIAGKSVQLGSNHISMGDLALAQSPAGLSLGLDALAALSQIEDLTLRSSETIDFYGAFTLGRALGSKGLATQITFDAAGLVGTSNAGKTAVVNAATVNLFNTNNVAGDHLPAAGTGGLIVNARNVNFGGNVFADGMTSTQLLATSSVTSVSSGLLDVRHGSLTLQGAQVTAAPLVSRVIQASNGSLNLLASTADSGAAVTNAGGARLQLIAQDIAQNGTIELPGGVVVLQATSGNVAFGAGSRTNASGFSKNFFDVARQAPAGRVDVIAAGNVTVAAGAVVDVSSAGDAGTITVAASGKFHLDGAFNGQGGIGYRNAGISVDANAIDNFDGVNALLNGSGFDRERSFRVRAGDVTIGAGTTINAHSFTLSTDSGAITIAGNINASGPTPGMIRLTGSGDVVLKAGAVLDARGASPDDADRAGSVTLETATGVVDAQSGSRIEVGAGVTSGVLTLRVARTGSDIGAGNRLKGVVNGAGAVNIEAFAVYDGITTLASSGSSGGTLTFTTIDQNNARFINAAGSTIRARLAGELTAANPGFDAGRLHLLAGAEVRSRSDLTVTNNDGVNLANYRYNGEAGVLTLRAAGSLTISGNISDGFTTASAASGQLLKATDQNARSWSYRLIAGADLSAGDVRQAHQPGDVVLAAGTLIRTGTGDIGVYAGRDVKFVARDSVLYTAGVGRDLTGLPAPAGVAYGINGGGVTVVAGGNISDGNPVSAGGSAATAPSEELITAWLYRQGNAIAGQPTSWWVDYTQFQQGGVGALGGGNVSIRAGDPRSSSSGNVNNLSVVLPTSGLFGGGQQQFVAGGGDLTMEAAGNINSGLFYVGKGIGDIRTNRSFGSARVVSDTDPSAPFNAKSLPIFPILALGDARLNLVAGGDATIQAIFNPTATIQAKRNADGATKPWSTFFTYTDRSAVAVTAVGGKAYVYGDVTALYQSVGFNTIGPNSPQATGAIDNALYTGGSIPNKNDGSFIGLDALVPYQIAPPTLKITTFNGDAGFDGAITLYPASRGTLDLLSASAIRVMTPGPTINPIVGGITIADADPFRLPNPTAPDVNMVGALARLVDDPTKSYTVENDVSRERLHATYVLHKGDQQPVHIYAANGNLNLLNSSSAAATPIPIVSAKSVRLWAANDIFDLKLLAQNVDPLDVSVVRAGRDIRFATSAASGNSTQVNIAGPGIGDFEAGRNIDLGSAQNGIKSIGNLRNPALPSDGASIVAAAGMTDVHYADFARAYLDPALSGRLYNDLLVDYINERHPQTAVATPEQAWRAFLMLAPDDQAPLIRRIFYAELRASADEAAHRDPRQLTSYDRGFRAINTLFPTSRQRSGDIRMFSSQVATLDGGDIDLLAPSGAILLGVTQKTTSNPQGIGIQIQRAGSIYSMSYGDVIVNQAAVHTLGGGDIVMWSTTGNIDAGKGAKTRKNITAPAFRTDMNGLTVSNPGSSATGAGIATLQATAGAKPGDVSLATPDGFVDAGDAGIRVSGNLIIAAVQILNASNIQVQGNAVGLPTVIAPNLASLVAASSAVDSATKAAQLPVGNAPAPQDQPSVIIVEVLGYGGESSERREKPQE
jgi:filamentous hemagglutinin family protein